MRSLFDSILIFCAISGTLYLSLYLIKVMYV